MYGKMDQKMDHCELLGVSINATDADINRAFRKMALKVSLVENIKCDIDNEVSFIINVIYSIFDNFQSRVFSVF